MGLENRRVWTALSSLQNSGLKIQARVNYHIHTEAIKENLIPETLTAQQINQVYANEADLLNMAISQITLLLKMDVGNLHLADQSKPLK